MKLDARNRFQYGSFWWLHLMVAVWMLFALMVYVLEPFVIHRFFQEFALQNKDRAFAVATGLHAAALIISAFERGRHLPSLKLRQGKQGPAPTRAGEFYPTSASF